MPRMSWTGGQAAIAAGSFALTAAALMLSNVGQQASAQALANHNSNAPVNFGADSIELQDRADRVIVNGNVRVEQAGLVLNAARMVINFTRSGGTDVHRIDASGGVTVRKGQETARGNVALYDLDRRIITMVGNVQLNQGANVLRGERLMIDLNTGRASVDGSGTPSSAGEPGSATTSSGGRVTGTFTVPDRKP